MMTTYRLLVNLLRDMDLCISILEREASLSSCTSTSLVFSLCSLLFMLNSFEVNQSIELCVLLFIFMFNVDVPAVNDVHLKMLLIAALKIDDCARLIPFKDRLPLRYRRSLHLNKFQCVISLT
jgi:hypothetical protein